MHCTPADPEARWVRGDLVCVMPPNVIIASFPAEELHNYFSRCVNLKLNTWRSRGLLIQNLLNVLGRLQDRTAGVSMFALPSMDTVIWLHNNWMQDRYIVSIQRR